MDTGPLIAERVDGRVHVQHGPIDLLISIDATPESRAAAIDSIRTVCDGLLAGLVTELDQLRSDRPGQWAVSGPTAARMVDAVGELRDLVFVTPMAAVAGSVADTVCAAVCAGIRTAIAATPSDHSGFERIIVNNGGDIAFALADGAHIDVGLADVVTGEMAGTVRVASSDPVRGVATSGRHGRSLTMGIADSVTVFARSSAAADAAATVIAGAVDLPGSDKVHRVQACEIDAASDLAERNVVATVEPLTQDEESEALANGLQLADTLLKRSLIVAAYLRLGGSAASTSLPGCLAAPDTDPAPGTDPDAGVDAERSRLD